MIRWQLTRERFIFGHTIKQVQKYCLCKEEREVKKKRLVIITIAVFVALFYILANAFIGWLKAHDNNIAAKVVRQHHLEDSFNSDQIQYEIGYTLVQDKKKKVPWGINKNELKTLEDRYLIEDYENNLSYLDDKDSIFRGKAVVTYYFNQNIQMNKIIITSDIEETPYDILFNLLYDGYSKTYFSDKKSGECVTELTWTDEKGISHFEVMKTPSFGMDLTKTLVEMMHMDEQDTDMDYNALMTNHEMSFRQTFQYHSTTCTIEMDVHNDGRAAIVITWLYEGLE